MKSIEELAIYLSCPLENNFSFRIPSQTTKQGLDFKANISAMYRGTVQ